MGSSSNLLLPMVIVMVGFFLVSTSAGAFAAASSTYVLDPKLPDESSKACSGLGGSWSNSNSTCLLRFYFTLNSGDLLKIESGASLDMLGRRDDSAIALEVSSGARIANYGTVILRSNSVIRNQGIVDNFKGGVINSTSDSSNMYWESVYTNGIMINHDGGTILNYRRGIYNERIFVNNGTILSSDGEIINVEGGRFRTNGNITNKGGIKNLGEFYIYGNVDTQNGSLVYTTLPIQKGYVIYNYESGIITTHGEGRINNNGGAIFNLGRIEINGGLLNKGVIDNYGLIFNNGNTVNNSNGTINNHNIGSIDNKAVLANYGNITSIFGRFSNSGYIKKYCGSVIDGTVSGESAADNTCISATTTATTTMTTVTSTRSAVQRIEEPTLYVWALSAIVAAAVLATLLILQRRRTK